ncbi:hypothetical protein DM482_11095 [Avibacterium paragallinarum]|uniref:Uncharacterized protein n=1 Tax=Avibacterium paragallinarum TaxID=728 RepID=A0AAE5WGJ5_AVIPA|nr:hypothetical protein DM482_11095 [Avibacterium paragallinarum]PXZ39705.1 hypothetical protein DM481_11360 [Avibacterium paragallinarum]
MVKFDIVNSDFNFEINSTFESGVERLKSLFGQAGVIPFSGIVFLALSTLSKCTDFRLLKLAEKRRNTKF